MAGEVAESAPPSRNAPPKRPFSVWAILAMLLSVTAFCPVFSLLAVLFALRALAEIKVYPELRGRRLSFAAIIIAIIVTIGWLVGGLFWNNYARMPMLSGPVVELQAGLSGDVSAFRSGFSSDGAMATDEEVRRFLDEVSHRYGGLLGGEQDSSAKGSMPVGGQGRIPYVLHFRNGDVRAEALFITFGGSVFRPVFSWDWVRILDTERGDLVYPLAAQVRAQPPAATTQP